MPESLELKKQRTLQILALLQRAYPAAKCSLEHRNAFELLVATILSAQCTDARVNAVTPTLFKAFRTPQAMAQASQAQLEELVKTTGFFRSKAKALKAMSADIVEKHSGQVPDTMDALTDLRGVGRKTANVVLGNAFGKALGIVVDTHVGRLALRLSLTRHKNPEKAEQDLMKLVPQQDWVLLPHLLIYHGRAICTARNPHCPHCPLLELCPTGKRIVKQGAKAPSHKGTKGMRNA